ncbi:MAG: hypothetical protein WC979_02770 [Candidatus Pacearchaeota archaeon]|jgi:hypothetical protein|nr:hypothetical protein [Clostridia bacterium]
MKRTKKDIFLFNLKYYFWLKWVDLYYDAKWTFWALRKYFKVVTKMRPWDYAYILEMQKFQMGILLADIDKGYEENTSKGLKVKQMKRWIELCENHLKDDYAERCGYLYDQEFDFELIEETKDKPKGEKLYRVVTTDGKQTAEERSECIRKANDLANAEWAEMNTIIKGTGVVNIDKDSDWDMGDGTDARGYWA